MGEKQAAGKKEKSLEERVIPSQKEVNSLVYKVYRSMDDSRPREVKEPVKEYQELLNKLPGGTNENDFIKYAISCILGEPKHGCRFLAVMEDEPYIAWIRFDSERYPKEIASKAMRMLKENGWNYANNEIVEVEEVVDKVGNKRKNNYVRIDGWSWYVASTAVKRGEQRKKEEEQES